MLLMKQIQTIHAVQCRRNMTLLVRKAIDGYLQYGGQDARRRQSDGKARHIGALFGAGRVGYADRLDLIGESTERFFKQRR